MNKLRILLIVIFIILICIFTFLIIDLRNNYIIRKDFENDMEKIASQNNKPVFFIDKIIFFSNCSATSKIADNSNIILENVYQYTDIAIYINNDIENSGIFSLENTLKELYIDNIEFIETPSIGKQSLYYKNLHDFTKNEFSDNNLINDNLSFKITSDDISDFSTPVLYNNCANPITISYLNDNLKTDYGIESSSSITYDGSLLNECYITLTSLSCVIKFDVHIVNNLDEEFVCSVSLDIPLSDGDSNLTDGTIIVQQDTNYVFNKIL